MFVRDVSLEFKDPNALCPDNVGLGQDRVKDLTLRETTTYVLMLRATCLLCHNEK